MKKLLVIAVFVIVMTGGMPALHGLSGRDFGAAVSGLAQTDPLQLASHVSGR